MRIRALPVVDRLSRDGEELVLVGSEVVLLSPIAAAVLREADGWADAAEVAARVVAEFGVPTGINPVAWVEAAAEELALHRLVEIASDSPHI